MDKMKIWLIISNNCWTLGHFNSYEKAEMYCINRGYAKLSKEYFLKITGLMCETITVKETEISKESHPFLYLVMNTKY
jgi:hypothetical protein